MFVLGELDLNEFTSFLPVCCLLDICETENHFKCVSFNSHKSIYKTHIFVVDHSSLNNTARLHCRLSSRAAIKCHSTLGTRSVWRGLALAPSPTTSAAISTTVKTSSASPPSAVRLPCSVVAMATASTQSAPLCCTPSVSSEQLASFHICTHFCIKVLYGLWSNAIANTGYKCSQLQFNSSFLSQFTKQLL